MARTLWVAGLLLVLASLPVAFAKPAKKGGKGGKGGKAAPAAAAGAANEFAPLPGKDWPTYGGSYNNQRFSTLKQINTTNVKGLKGAWTFHTKHIDAGASFQNTPIVVDGVMYVTSGKNDVWALDAKTGDVKWEYPSTVDIASTTRCCGVNNRGVAVGKGKVFMGQLDGKLVAIDAATGKKSWEVLTGEPKEGYSQTMAPLFYDGMVIIGIAGAEFETRGYVTAYNADTGKQIWRWYTIPAPGEPGSETWPPGDIYKHGGGSMWMTPSVDPALGLVYLAVGNPGPDLDGTVRKGDNLYTESIVALEVKTGKYKWHFQTVHHDIWDYDAVSPIILFDATVKGKPAKGLAQAGKTGWVYLLDRVTGKPLLSIKETPVPQLARQFTSPTQPFPEGDAFTAQDATVLSSKYPKGKMFGVFEESPVLLLPGANGGSEWSPMSYSPDTNYVYISDIFQPQVFTLNPAAIEQGKLKLGSSFTVPPGLETAGNLVAIDVRTNKIAWKKPQKFMMIGGSFATAGGLVFVGQGDGNFEAYNAKNGDRLWQFQTGAGVNAAPMAYEVDGEQFIAVAAGGNVQLDYPRGDTVWVFSLKGKLGPVAAPTAPPTTPTAEIIGEAVEATEIDMSNFKYTPSNVKVKVGTTVTWTQSGPFTHSATSDDNGKTFTRPGMFNSKMIETGQKYSFKFEKPGVYNYHCIAHPWQVGRIEVVGADGKSGAAAKTAGASAEAAPGAATKSSKTRLYVIGGAVVVLVLGGLIFFMRKKPT